MKLLVGLTWLIVFQILGSLISELAWPAVPGPVLGLILLFIYFLVTKDVPESVEVASNDLLRYMPLLLVPPAVGIVKYTTIIIPLFFPLLITLIGSLAVSIIVTGWIMKLSINIFERTKENKK